MKIYNNEVIAGLPCNVINLDDELMGISIYYEPLNSKEDEPAKGEWRIVYADSGSSIQAKASTLKKCIEKIKKEIHELDNTPLRI